MQSSHAPSSLLALLAVYVVKRIVFAQCPASGDLDMASHGAIEEEDQYPPATSGQAKQIAEPISKPAAEDSLELCLLAIHAVLPLLVGQGYQLRACVEVKEHDDPHWTLNAATAELHCLQAEDWYEFGKSEKALNVIGKVAPSNPGDVIHVIAINLSLDKVGAIPLSGNASKTFEQLHCSLCPFGAELVTVTGIVKGRHGCSVPCQPLQLPHVITY